jgi:hypothetical protein
MLFPFNKALINWLVGSLINQGGKVVVSVAIKKIVAAVHPSDKIFLARSHLDA